MSKLCETHSLALADDGKCVLCRRQEPRFVALQSTERTAADRIVTAMLGAGVLLTCGLVVWAFQIARGTDPQPKATAGSTVASRATLPPAGQPGGPRPIALAAVSRSASPPTPSAPTAHRTATGRAQAHNRRAKDPSPAPKAVRDERAERALYAAQTSVEAAKRKVPIQMFSTSWCTICESSRYYLMGRELNYQDLDIERDRRAAARLGRINRMRSVPTFVIDGEVLIGFNAWQIEGALEDAARRRLAKQPGQRCRADRRCQAR